MKALFLDNGSDKEQYSITKHNKFTGKEPTKKTLFDFQNQWTLPGKNVL